MLFLKISVQFEREIPNSVGHLFHRFNCSLVGFSSKFSRILVAVFRVLAKRIDAVLIEGEYLYLQGVVNEDIQKKNVNYVYIFFENDILTRNWCLLNKAITKYSEVKGSPMSIIHILSKLGVQKHVIL